MRTILMILILSLSVFAQGESSWQSWGGKVLMGNELGSNYKTVVGSENYIAVNDTLYTVVQPLSAADHEGIGAVAVYMDDIDVSGTASAVSAAWRYGFRFPSANSGSVVAEWQFGPWNELGVSQLDTLYHIEIADSAAWKPAANIQFRFISVDAGDSTAVRFQPFIK